MTDFKFENKQQTKLTAIGLYIVEAAIEYLVVFDKDRPHADIFNSEFLLLFDIIYRFY